MLSSDQAFLHESLSAEHANPAWRQAKGSQPQDEHPALSPASSTASGEDVWEESRPSETLRRAENVTRSCSAS